jgi:hypothetical protein
MVGQHRVRVHHHRVRVHHHRVRVEVIPQRDETWWTASEKLIRGYRSIPGVYTR